ncbi:hypothetical protein [Natrarchaeobius oligotrophus]|uniref:Uncharacterized protein n=1 Tax=Natrarchaeobius chitinivorans TaxID=1679083 RepID=A0A3N6MH24_NATCH|nr:hypothetical protein [Natrarchaeobius chitinivorans]RQH03309.1 hypothetical protein EA472_01640 [Natrarchaeobius chitinivorans]
MADTDRITPASGIVLGAVLVVLGLGAYALTDFASVTALIPAFFGVVFVGLGTAGRRFDRPELTTYGIGALAVLGILGSARGIPDVIALATGGSVDSVVAATSQGVMVVVCVLLVAAVARDVLGS